MARAKNESVNFFFFFQNEADEERHAGKIIDQASFGCGDVVFSFARHTSCLGTGAVTELILRNLPRFLVSISSAYKMICLICYILCMHVCMYGIVTYTPPPYIFPLLQPHPTHELVGWIKRPLEQNTRF